jgi:hypothetical protein
MAGGVWVTRNAVAKSQHARFVEETRELESMELRLITVRHRMKKGDQK